MTLEQIDQALDRRVRPQLALHGGDIQSVGLEGSVYRFRLTGQCAGCPSAYLTTETLIREELLSALPELRDAALEQGVSEGLLDQARAILGRHV